MKAIRDILDGVFPLDRQRPGKGSVGGVLIWHGQRTVDRFFYGPGEENLSLENYMVRHFRDFLEPPGQGLLRVMRYEFERGYQFEHNCEDLFDRVEFLRGRAQEAFAPAPPAGAAPPGFQRPRTAAPAAAAGAAGPPGFRQAAAGRPARQRPAEYARREPETAVEALQALLQTAEADARDGHPRHALYLFQTFGIHFLRNVQEERGLLLRGFLNALPEKLYQLGHLLVFIASTAEQAQSLKAELFGDSPFVQSVAVPEPDEETIFCRLVSAELRGERNWDVIASAGLTAAWLQRNSTGRNRLFRSLYDKLADRVLDAQFLRDNDVRDIEDLIIERDLDELKAELRAQIYNQDDAIERIVEGLTLVKAEFENRREDNAPRRSGPLFRALLAGPSGTGKSHLARVLARTLFGNEPFEIIMQNITNRTSLVGAPAGHVGFGQVHSALERLQQSGSGVVLIDEWERAGSDPTSQKSIHDCFMSVFEEGRIDTEDRRQISFQDTIILVTTNLGMHSVDYDENGRLVTYRTREERQEAYKRVITDRRAGNYIELPWLGRLGGEPIVFNPFQPQDMVHLATIEWAACLRRQSRHRPPQVIIEDDELARMYCNCYSPDFGARMLRDLVATHATKLWNRADMRDVVRMSETVRLGWHDGQVELLQ